MTDSPGYGYITVESSKALEACTNFLKWCDEQYQQKKQNYIENLLQKKHGWLWNKRFYTAEEAEHMWYNGNGDCIYTPHQLAELSGAVWKNRVKSLMVLAKNSETVMISDQMSFIFS